MLCTSASVCWLRCAQGLHQAQCCGQCCVASACPAREAMASLPCLPSRGWRPRGGTAGLLFWTHLVKSVTGSSLHPARSGQQPRDQQCPCCSFPSPGNGEGDAGFDVRAQDWGQAVCAHESLAGLQLPLKCSSDQDEREGSPSPNHLALIAGRNASPHPPWGGACRSWLIPPLVWAGAEGESLGTKGGFSQAARNRRWVELLGLRTPLRPVWSRRALGKLPGKPMP